jgi:hypothetical protein
VRLKLLGKIRKAREKVAVAWAAPTPAVDLIAQGMRREYAAFFEALEVRGERRFVRAKWRLGADWDPAGEKQIGRPLSADELATRLALPVESVRDTDVLLVSHYRQFFQGGKNSLSEAVAAASKEGRSLDLASYYFEFVGIPIDEAQAWWDAKYAARYSPDGRPLR